MMQKALPIAGPLSLLFTLALAAKSAVVWDLAFIAAVGLILCARWQIRGCCYSLVLLGVSSIIRHSFFVSDPLWILGLEGSFVCAFFIIALTFEQEAVLKESLHSQVETGKAALRNLEEELAKVQEIAQEQQIAFQEKVAALRKELEDLQAEHSSILILNEVLRKTTARHTQENEAIQTQCADLHWQREGLKAECEEYRKELARLKNGDALVKQNAELMKELNAARYEREQTHLINETLARLYVRESLKAKEADQEAASMADQLAAARRERIVQQPPQEDPQLAAKMMHLSQIEPLFKQLKKQFEEKDQVLHQTRSTLFKTDTELQKLKMEKLAFELNPIPKEVEEEIHSLSAQVLALEEENRHLHELVTVLSGEAKAL